MDVPVVIVGGGPTGLGAALCLARHGVASLLVERHPTPAIHPQAHVVNRRTMELFGIWGIADDVLAAAYPPERLGAGAIDLPLAHLGELTPAEQAVVDEHLAGDAEARVVASPAPRASCAQDIVERLLLAAADAHELTDIRYGVRCARLTQEDGGVRARLEPAEGLPLEVTARYAIAADGAASGTRAALGLGTIGDDDLGAVLNVYFHADLSASIGDPAPLLAASRDPAVPGGFISMDGRERWVLNMPIPTREGWEETYPLDVCTDLVRRAAGAGPEVALDVRSVKPWTMTARVAERLRVGDVFLAGDAAHAFPPTGGFGMNSGLQDAHNLAWKLAAVLGGWADPALLDTYEAERQPVAFFNTAQSLRNAGRGVGGVNESPEARTVVARASTSVHSVLDDGLSPGLRGFFAMREHFLAVGQDVGFAYVDEGAAVVPDGLPRPDVTVSRYLPNACPGARVPHVALGVDGTECSTIDLADGRFTVFTGDDPTRWVAAASEVVTGRGLPAGTVGVVGIGTPGGAEDLADRWTAVAGVDADGVVLTRPDGHVGWRHPAGVDDPAGALAAALDVLLGAPAT